MNENMNWHNSQKGNLIASKKFTSVKRMLSESRFADVARRTNEKKSFTDVSHFAGLAST